MTELWIASENPHKRRELERLVAPLGYRVRTPNESPVPVTFVEDGETFAHNARAKATALARATASLALGDDSGLCVDALAGRPGVRSARYAGPNASDSDRIRKLCDELEGVADRSARFVCHVCLSDGDGRVVASFEEHCAGVITGAPRGSAGFGYDPIFVAAEHRGRDPEPTFAELSAEDKDAVSHRGRALRRLVAFLSERASTQRADDS